MSASVAGRRLRVFLTHSPEMLTEYYGERAVAALREQAELRVNATGEVLAGAVLVRAAGNAEVLVADRQTAVGGEVFAGMPGLRAVCRVAVDISTIDVEAASRHGVLVTRATPGFGAAVAELAVGMLVDLARGVSGAVVQYRRGEEAIGRRGRQLQGAVLGVIGYGVIGERLAALGVALGMAVLVHDPHRQPEGDGMRAVGFKELLEGSDYVVCLAASGPGTVGMMDRAAFGRMRRGACFVNLSRGELVDEAALEAALDSGQLGGAAMDVGRAADQRPNLALARRADVVATPHIGGLVPEAVEHQAFDTVRQVAALARGELPPGAVNAEAAWRWRG